MDSILFRHFRQDLQDLLDLFFAYGETPFGQRPLILLILLILSKNFYRNRIHSSFIGPHGIFILNEWIRSYLGFLDRIYRI